MLSSSHFYSVKEPSQWDGTTHIQGGSSHFSQPNLEAPSDLDQPSKWGQDGSHQPCPKLKGDYN